ncbi:hypothetical protein V6Z11_D02G116900 [Gossypium hirsutum]
MKKEFKTSSSGSEMESWVHLIGSGEEEREKERGQRVIGERESRVFVGEWQLRKYCRPWEIRDFRGGKFGH